MHFSFEFGQNRFSSLDASAGYAQTAMQTFSKEHYFDLRVAQADISTKNSKSIFCSRSFNPPTTYPEVKSRIL